MRADSERSNRGAEYVLFAAVVVCVACAFFVMDYIPDDSYISFRYAENLAAGHGLRFNPSEQPVEGYSNFLWILFCALVHTLGLNLPGAIPTVGTLLSIFNVTLLWALYRRRGMPALQMLVPLLVLAGSGPVVMYAVSGMEMPLYAFLLLLMLFALDSVLVRGRTTDYVLLVAASFLLALCRPEGMAALPIAIGAVLWLRRRESPKARAEARWRRKLFLSLLVFAACLCVYHFWRVSYFGEWLPTPFLSKGGGGVSLGFAWVENLKFYFVKHMYYTPPMGYYFFALFILSIAGLKLSRSEGGTRVTEGVAVLLVAVYALIYINFRDWMPGMRYHSPYIAVLLLPAAQLLTPVFAVERPKRSMAPFWLAGFAVVLLNLGVLAELRVVAHIAETSNQLCPVALGKWLKKTMPSNAVLATSDVGAIPYYSGLETIDIHPNSLTDLTIAKNGFSIDYIAQRNPDVIIVPSRSFAVAKFYPEHFQMASDKRFDETRLLGVSRADWYEDRSYWVYVKKSVPELTDEQASGFPTGLGTMRRVYK